MILKITISGKVQGVGFRKSVLAFVIDHKLAIIGIVRNLDSSEVEVIAQGSEGQLQKLYNFCQTGPINSKVLQIKKEVLLILPIDIQNMNEFNIRY